DVVQQGTADNYLGARVNELLRDRSEVGGFRWVDLIGSGGYPAGLQLLLGKIYLWLGEGVVFGCVGGRGGPLRRGQRQQPLHEIDESAGHRQGDIEDVG